MGTLSSCSLYSLILAITLILELSSDVIGDVTDEQLVWFRDLEIPKNHSFDDVGMASPEEFPELSEKHLRPSDLSQIELELWERLIRSNGDSPLTTYVILNKILSLRPTDNFRYRGFSKSDIQYLIEFKPLRLKNCMIKHMKSRKEMSSDGKFMRYRKIRDYLTHYLELQEKFCWSTFLSMLSTSVQAIDSKDLEQVTSITNSFRDNRRALALDIIEESALINGLLNYLVNTRIIYIRPEIDRQRAGRIIRSTILRTLNGPCKVLNEAMGGFVALFDTMYPRRSRNSSQYPFGDDVIDHLASWRICFKLMNKHHIRQNIADAYWLRMYPKSSPTAEEQDSSSGQSSADHVSSTSSSLTIDQNYASWNEELFISSEPRNLRALNYARMSQEEKDAWNTLTTGVGLKTFSAATKSISLILEANDYRPIFFGNVTNEMLRSLREYSRFKIGNCSTEEMDKRYEYLSRGNWKVIAWLAQYMQHYFLVHDEFCWHKLQDIVIANVSELHPSTVAKMDAILDKKSIDSSTEPLEADVFSYTVLKAIAQAYMNEPKVKEALSSGAIVYPVTFRVLLSDTIKPHCSYVENAVGEFNDHFDRLKNTADRPSPPLSSEIRRWMAFNRICRSLEQDPVFFQYVYTELLNLMNSNKSVASTSRS